MSYIDTFDHEFVGFFGHLPVYHPLVEHEADGSEFSCNPNNLIIGGGSGEHPALILKRPDRAVTAFITEWRDRTENEPKSRPESAIATILRWSEQWIDEVEGTVHRLDALEFAGWDTERFHSFFEMCASPVIRTPYPKEGVFEEWLLASMGEFILFSMPELVPGLEQQLPGVREVTYPLYTNILLPPSGYPIKAGRRVLDGQLIWNQRWWRSNP